MSHAPRRLGAIALCATLVTMPVHAETGRFDLKLGPVRAGVLEYSAEEKGGRYATAGAVRSAGLAGMFLDAEIDASAQGSVTGNRYRPSQFRATSTENGETVKTELRYGGGAPSMQRDPAWRKPPKYAAAPQEQAGTIDPMTAAFALLRDRPRDMACDIAFDMFDGRRRADIRLVGGAPTQGGGLECRGEYRREQGFSPKELSEKPVWPFTVLYAPVGEVLRVMELRVPTTFGSFRMERR